VLTDNFLLKAGQVVVPRVALLDRTGSPAAGVPADRPASRVTAQAGREVVAGPPNDHAGAERRRVGAVGHGGRIQ